MNIKGISVAASEGGMSEENKKILFICLGVGLALMVCGILCAIKTCCNACECLFKILCCPCRVVGKCFKKCCCGGSDD